MTGNEKRTPIAIPATKRDIDELREVLVLEIHKVEDGVTTRISRLEQRMDGQLDAIKRQVQHAKEEAGRVRQDCIVIKNDLVQLRSDIQIMLRRR